MGDDPIIALGEISGGELLHAWPVCAKPQAWWIQVHSPRLAKYLGRRKDCRRVAASVAGEYLRTDEIRRPKGFVARLVGRMLRAKSPNGGAKTLPSPRTRRATAPATPIPRKRHGAFEPANSCALP